MRKHGCYRQATKIKMDKYFEGFIKYICESDQSDSFKEIVFVKNNFCRFESIYEDSKSTSIDTPDKVYFINYEEKTVVDCGNDNRDRVIEEIKISELDEKEFILNHECSIFKIEGKVEFEGDIDIIDEKHYVNKKLQISSALKVSSSLFRTSYIPLKTIRKIKFEDIDLISTTTALEIKRESLDQNLFSPDSFKNFERITSDEDERRWEEKTKAEKEKRDKEWAKLEEKMEEQSKIMTTKLIKFLEIEFKRELTKSEKENPHQYLLSQYGKVSSEEGLELSKKFLKYL